MVRGHITASNQPSWFGGAPDTGPVQVSCWGADAVRQSYPCKTFIEGGVARAFGSDLFVGLVFTASRASRSHAQDVRQA